MKTRRKSRARWLKDASRFTRALAELVRAVVPLIWLLMPLVSSSPIERVPGIERQAVRSDIG